MFFSPIKSLSQASRAILSRAKTFKLTRVHKTDSIFTSSGNTHKRKVRGQMPGEFNWDPITVDITVSAVSLLRDRAIAAWAAAGDTVVLDGVTVAQGTAGRGVWRIFGFAAFLTQIDGCPRNYRPYPDIGQYTYPDNTTVRNASGMWRNGRFREDPAQSSQHTTSVTLTCTNGGATDMVTPITCRATINGITDQGIIYPGSVTFNCGNWSRESPVWSQVVNGQIIRYAETTFTGADLGDHTGSYSMLAQYDGTYCSTGNFFNASSAGMVIGVN